MSRSYSNYIDFTISEELLCIAAHGLQMGAPSSTTTYARSIP